MSRNQDGGGGGGPTTRLPDIYASPGNVGVQIDSYRTKDMFNRPRSNKFTTAFHGHMFQDHTLKNAKRMLAREIQRKRDDEERTKKLAEYQTQRLEAKVQMEEKRKHREYLRKQRAWEMQQAMKAASQLALEHRSVVRIQAMHRGCRVRRTITRQERAATAIQATVRRRRAQQEYDRQRHARRELQNKSAVLIQSQVRRRLSTKRVANMRAAIPIVDTPRSLSTEALFSTTPPTDHIISSPPPSVAAPCKEDGVRAPVAVVLVPTPPPAKPRPPPSTNPSANVVLKRVGGGFRRIVKPPQLEIVPMPPSSARSQLPSLANTPTKKPLPKPQPPQRSFLQRWNDVPSPVAKSLESFIQDPNLAGKLKFASPTRPMSDVETPVVWRSRDAAELCAAMDAALQAAETFDGREEERQPPLTPQDIVELTKAMDDMASIDDTAPECLDDGLSFVAPVLPIMPPMEKPPSRPEVVDALPDLPNVEAPTVVLLPPDSSASHEGEWTVLLDEDFDTKATFVQDREDDHRIEQSETSSVVSSIDTEDPDFPEQSVATATPVHVQHRPKSILKKSAVANPMAAVVAVGSTQYSLRKDPKRAHWVEDDACDDVLLGASPLPLALT